VVDRPAAIDVIGLEFDDVNVEHLARHGVTPDDLWSVLLTAPQFFMNLPDHGGSHVMLGPDERGRFFYASIVQVGTTGVWRPITGWPIRSARARRLYREEN
jgi:hypothetical protein